MSFHSSVCVNQGEDFRLKEQLSPALRRVEGNELCVGFGSLGHLPESLFSRKTLEEIFNDWWMFVERSFLSILKPPGFSRLCKLFMSPMMIQWNERKV